MADSTATAARPTASASPPPPPIKKRPAALRFPIAVILLAISTHFLVPLIFPSSSHGFSPADFPTDAYARPVVFPTHDTRVLRSIEKIGNGLLLGPEDLAYDADERVLYTGCYDGWIRRVHLANAAGKDFRTPLVEDWLYVGGRPLGVALAPAPAPGKPRRLYVADALNGLIAADPPADGIGAPTVTLLATGAEGVPFGLTDGVDVADDGMVYFTDASSKYGMDNFTLDILEGRPYGRLMSYDPETNVTKVLVDGLYFANGVAVAPGGGSVVFCESYRRRCSRYFREGENEGTVEVFVDRLPGFPDNVRYCGDGTYLIALFSGRSLAWDLIAKYPWIRRALHSTGLYGRLLPWLMYGSGVAEVALDGTPNSLRTDPGLRIITVGLKVRNHLYLGALLLPHVGRVQLPAAAVAPHDQ